MPRRTTARPTPAMSEPLLVGRRGFGFARRKLGHDALALRLGHGAPAGDLVERARAAETKARVAVDDAHVDARGGGRGHARHVGMGEASVTAGRRWLGAPGRARPSW